jgi:5'-3' exonuclease
MSEYESKMLIEELEKLVVSKQLTINCKDIEIEKLKKEIERLEHLLTPKSEIEKAC